MSNILYWKPVPEKTALSNALKHAVSHRYFDGEDTGTMLVNANHLDYFRGLAYVGVEDANVIIEFINKYERILLSIE